MAQDISSI